MGLETCKPVWIHLLYALTKWLQQNKICCFLCILQLGSACMLRELVCLCLYVGQLLELAINFHCPTLRDTPTLYKRTQTRTHTFITYISHMMTETWTCVMSFNIFALITHPYLSNIIPDHSFGNTLANTNLGCQCTSICSVVSGTGHLNSSKECVVVKWMQLSPPLQYTFKQFNSGPTLITAKQYTHKLQVLSPYTAWSQGYFCSMEAIIQGKGD